MSPHAKRTAGSQASPPVEPDIGCVELGCVIVNMGVAERVHHIARDFGVHGETVLVGKGTVQNSLLEFLDLCDIRKEIVLMLAVKSKIRPALARIAEALRMNKPNHGIAFSFSVCQIVGTRTCVCELERNMTGGERKVYQAIFVIVDKGRAEMAIEAATKAGSSGGTIINARGSGIHETSRLFSMDIEPEKEIVLLLTEQAMTEQVAAAIRQELKLDEPGNGVAFIMDITQAYGLF